MSKQESPENELYKAVVENNSRKVKLLLEAKANPNQLTPYGYGPIHQATFQKSTKIIALLIAGKSQVDLETPFGCTPLRLAVKERHKESIFLLLDYGANPDKEEKLKRMDGKDFDSGSILRNACEYNLDKETIEYIRKCSWKANRETL